MIAALAARRMARSEVRQKPVLGVADSLDLPERPGLGIEDRGERAEPIEQLLRQRLGLRIEQHVAGERARLLRRLGDGGHRLTFEIR